jgi:hypothetical protein
VYVYLFLYAHFFLDLSIFTHINTFLISTGNDNKTNGSSSSSNGQAADASVVNYDNRTNSNSNFRNSETVSSVDTITKSNAINSNANNTSNPSKSSNSTNQAPQFKLMPYNFTEIKEMPTKQKQNKISNEDGKVSNMGNIGQQPKKHQILQQQLQNQGVIGVIRPVNGAAKNVNDDSNGVHKDYNYLKIDRIRSNGNINNSFPLSTNHINSDDKRVMNNITIDSNVSLQSVCTAGNIRIC